MHSIPILYQDDSLMVISKPAGLPVHSGSGGGDNLGNYFDDWRASDDYRPSMAHRLDRDTSGCLIIGRTKESLRRLGKMFVDGKITKTYWAVVKNPNFDKDEGTIDIPMRKKSPHKYHWHMEAHPEGQVALTHYKVLGKVDGFAWLELSPQTGRTHQLRIHCSASGSPIVGDKLYGNDPEENRPMMHLHARSLTIPYYNNSPPLDVVAPPPAHMLELLGKCGYRS
jgi:tRNA pseudouridine32 synthase/23S rRNA pseudouridine746 synthase